MQKHNRAMDFPTKEEASVVHTAVGGDWRVKDIRKMTKETIVRRIAQRKTMQKMAIALKLEG